MPARKPIKKKAAKNKGPRLSIRVSRQEKEALEEAVEDARKRRPYVNARKRRPYVNASIVFRELLGLTYTDLVTDEIRQRLRIRIERIRGRRDGSTPPVEDPHGYQNDGDSDPLGIYNLPPHQPGHLFPKLAPSEDDVDEIEPLIKTG